MGWNHSWNWLILSTFGFPGHKHHKHHLLKKSQIQYSKTVIKVISHIIHRNQDLWSRFRTQDMTLLDDQWCNRSNVCQKQRYSGNYDAEFVVSFFSGSPPLALKSSLKSHQRTTIFCQRLKANVCQQNTVLRHVLRHSSNVLL